MYCSVPNQISKDNSGTIDGKTLPVCEHPGVWASILFEPDDIVEVRCIPPKHVKEEMDPKEFFLRRFCRSYQLDPWVTAENLDRIVPGLKRVNHPDGVGTSWGIYDKKKKQWSVAVVQDVPLNIYCGANPRKEVGGTSKKDVAQCRSLFVDLEETAVEEAVDAVFKVGLPSPTMIVNSGHGVHLYWRLKAAITDLGHWTALQKRLIQAFGEAGGEVDAAVHDPARMMRMPGFANVNGDPRLAYIVEADPARHYDLGVIEAALPQAKQAPPTSQTKNGKPAPNGKPKNEAECSGKPKSNGKPRNKAEVLKRAMASLL